jgi:O-antigen/teichoic acid export membrane protein
MTEGAVEYPSTRRALALGMWGKAVEVATLALLVTLVPRVLGPRDYGSFALGLGLVTLGSSALALSGPVVMARFVAASPPLERAALARALALRALRWRAAGLAAAGVVAAALVLFDRDRFAPLPTALVLLAIVIDAPATVAFQVALALGRTAAWSFRYPLQNAVIVATVPALHAAGGVNGALGAIALSSAAALVAGLVLVGRPLLSAPAKAEVPHHVSRFALLQGWSNVFVQVQHRGVVVFAALLAGSRIETGYAALAAGVAVAATYAVWQLFTVTAPRLAAVANVDPEAASAALRRIARLALLTTAPIALLGVLITPWLLRSVLGADFSAAKDAFVPALATIPLAALTGVVAGASALQLRPEARLRATLVGAVTFVIAALALVPAFDSAGATGALLAGTAAAAVAGVALFPGLVETRLLVFSFAAAGTVLAVGLAR